jgi:hypothetical protein
MYTILVVNVKGGGQGCLYEHDGKRPVVHDSEYVAPNTVVCRDVHNG